MIADKIHVSRAVSVSTRQGDDYREKALISRIGGTIMPLRSKWLFILIGNDQTGKTILQKEILKRLTTENRDDRLDCNLEFEITHPHIKRKIRTFFIGNRSYQEKSDDYGSVEDYYRNQFGDADIAIISSHLNIDDVRRMISEGHKRFYNVIGVAFTNSIASSPSENQGIADLNWDERWIANNPLAEIWKGQLEAIADEFVQMLISRWVKMDLVDTKVEV
jgi:hypothetical protein